MKAICHEIILPYAATLDKFLSCKSITYRPKYSTQKHFFILLRYYLQFI